MTAPDPFAPPAAVAEPEPTHPVVGSATVAVRPVLGDIEVGGKIVMTFKEGTGYDASWIVVHANNVDEADAVLDQKFADLMEKTKRVAAAFRGGGIAGQATPVGQPSVSTAAPAGATSAPTGETRQCPHGQMNFKSGFSAKTNSTWKAFMCPTPKGTPGQCAPEWLKD